jgi:hypothetical protein
MSCPSTPEADLGWDDDVAPESPGSRSRDYESYSGGASSFEADEAPAAAGRGFGGVLAAIIRTVRGKSEDPAARPNRRRMKGYLRSQGSRAFEDKRSMSRTRSGAVVKNAQRRQAARTVCFLTSLCPKDCSPLSSSVRQSVPLDLGLFALPPPPPPPFGICAADPNGHCLCVGGKAGKYRLNRAITPLDTKHLVQTSGSAAEYSDSYGKFNPYSMG